MVTTASFQGDINRLKERLDLVMSNVERDAYRPTNVWCAGKRGPTTVHCADRLKAEYMAVVEAFSDFANGFTDSVAEDFGGSVEPYRDALHDLMLEAFEEAFGPCDDASDNLDQHRLGHADYGLRGRA